MSRTIDTDVLVAGGGPAGLATAIAARRAGLDVVVADAAQPAIDKACGEGLMPDGVDALARLGVIIPAGRAVPFRGIRFVDEGGSIGADFPCGIGLGMRRTTLHRILADAAQDADVRLMWGARVAMSERRVTVNDREVRSRWVIGADGHNSRIAAAAGLCDAGSGARRIGFREHYRVEPWSEHVEVHWSDCGQLYITPTAIDEVCVVFVTRETRLRLPEALSRFPEAARHLLGRRSSGRVLGGITGMRRRPRVCCCNVALVGDASGMVDAVTGEGLSIAFRQADALARAMADGDLAHYQRAHDEIMRRPRMMSRLLLLMDRHAWLRRRVFRVLSAAPHRFENLLAMHIGELSPWRVFAA